MDHSKQSNNTWVWIVPILTTVVAFLLSYKDTLAEPDMVRMITAMVYGGVTGEHIFAGYHYGIKFSFGYYELFYSLIPENKLQDPDYVTRFVNTVGLVFTFGFALSLSLMLNKLMDKSVAVFCTVAFLFCPVVLPFLASAHPMIGAGAFLFLGCWFILLTADKTNTAATIVFLGLAFVSLTVSLCLRGEIALAFPFVAVAYLVKSSKQTSPIIVRAAVVSLILGLAFASFLLLQKPFVVSEGGAINSLGAFLAQAASIKRIVRGVAILVVALGVITAVLLAVAAGLRAMDRKINKGLVLVCLALLLPSLLFWLPTPQPARHFVIAILGLYMLLGQLWANKLNGMKHALLMATLLVFGNQMVAELVRPIIINGYQWSYDAHGIRRATQQVPLGFVALDQQANKATEAVLRQESIRLAASKPERLVILADGQYYIIGRLLAQDPSLRLTVSHVGSFKALLLSNANKKIYLVEEKYPFWPKDVLSEVLTVAEVADYPIYVQPSTISRYDKTQVPDIRQYKIAQTL